MDAADEAGASDGASLLSHVFVGPGEVRGRPMSSRFLYVFGYETPGQARANAAHGWDDEDSRALWIEASSSEEALSWGRRVSEAFVAYLYGDAPVSWLADGYAHWIELEPGKAYQAEHLATMPTVRPGEYPDWEALLGHPRR